MSKSLSPYDSLRYIPLCYDYADSHKTALALILALRPEWQDSKDTIEFVRFTDGITNTVCTHALLATAPRLHPPFPFLPAHARLRRGVASQGGEQAAGPVQDGG